MDNEFMTMTQIGEQLGMTSHKVGRRLQELGFRTRSGKPTPLAFDLNLIWEGTVFNTGAPLYLWRATEIIRLLTE